jgi:hypothetical protein
MTARGQVTARGQGALKGLTADRARRGCMGCIWHEIPLSEDGH